jgi:hypothetical protein
MNGLPDPGSGILATAYLQPFLPGVLAATVLIQNADFGNIQLYNPATDRLEIVAQQAFAPEFLEYFNECWSFSANWRTPAGDSPDLCHGHGDVPTSLRATKAGVVEFLLKPFRDGNFSPRSKGARSGRCGGDEDA